MQVTLDPDTIKAIAAEVFRLIRQEEDNRNDDGMSFEELVEEIKRRQRKAIRGEK